MTQEQRFTAQCGFMIGWHDSNDAQKWARKHLIRCDSGCSSLQDLEFEHREKEYNNHSDSLPMGSTKYCDNCDAGNIEAQVMCAVCGGEVNAL